MSASDYLDNLPFLAKCGLVGVLGGLAAWFVGRAVLGDGWRGWRRGLYVLGVMLSGGAAVWLASFLSV